MLFQIELETGIIATGHYSVPSLIYIWKKGYNVISINPLIENKWNKIKLENENL